MNLFDQAVKVSAIKQLACYFINFAKRYYSLSRLYCTCFQTVWFAIKAAILSQKSNTFTLKYPDLIGLKIQFTLVKSDPDKSHIG